MTSREMDAPRAGTTAPPAGGSGDGRDAGPMAHPDRPDGLAGAIRPYRPGDQEALYRVCLRTGDGGNDASSLYSHPDLLGDVFVGPYLELQPQFAFVVDDGSGAEGYVLGALDSAAFATVCERLWWPAVRARYGGASIDQGSADAWLLRWIETPPPVPDFARDYPSHLHIDLLPRWQSGGWGRRLIERLMAELAAAGSTGVHLGVGRSNERAVGFYRHLGFTDLDGDDTTLWLGRPLP